MSSERNEGARARIERGNKPMGRKPKLTPERTARIIELIKAGNYIEVACAASGISEHTYFNWIAIGRSIESEHGEESEEWPSELTQYEADCGRFFQAIKIATAEAEAYAVTTIRAQMPQNWAAAMTYLERRFPGRWRRREELTVSNPFHVQGAAGAGIDEAALLRDPEAVSKLHEALVLAARGQLPKGEDVEPVVDATVVEDTEPQSTPE